MIVVFHQPRHQRRAELGVPTAGVVERQRRDVELALGNGGPLLLRLEQGLARIDPDLQPDVGRLYLAGDDLDHLVTYVALAPGPLVGGLEYRFRTRRPCSKDHQSGEKRHL